MEKSTPHTKLSVIRRLTLKGQIRPTTSALACANELGFDFDDMIGVLLALTPEDFYKSMTAHGDHRRWQEVYRPVTARGALYVKLTVVDDVLIVSFKDL